MWCLYKELSFQSSSFTTKNKSNYTKPECINLMTVIYNFISLPITREDPNSWHDAFLGNLI